MSYANQKLSREKVFRDPVHNYIYIQDKVILDLIDTPEFQRLRRIKQLGTVLFVFHGAEHSRFTHSLGVYEIARRICDNFQRNYPHQKAGDGLWDNSERLVALCAALLHDIGHGPYSHTFEHIFETDHEKITQDIITSPETNINKVLKRVSPDFPDKVASVINKTYPNPQVVQMISSQCDADRMDYLLRDSYNTGTKYGNFDLTRTLRVMRPYSGGICFARDGMHTIEDYVISRLQMYIQVYFHPVARSMEAILNRLLNRAKDLSKQMDSNQKDAPYLLLPFFNNNYSLSDYLELDDGVLNTYFIHWKHSKDPILSDLSHRFLDRMPLKSVGYNSNTQSITNKIKQIVQKNGFDPNYYTASDNSINLPYDASGINHSNQLKFRQDDGSLVELSTISPLINAVTGKMVSEERFFFPREIIDSSEDLYQYIRNDQLKNGNQKG